MTSPGTARSSVCEGTTGWRAAGTVQEVRSYTALTISDASYPSVGCFFNTTKSFNPGRKHAKNDPRNERVVQGRTRAFV